MAEIQTHTHTTPEAIVNTPGAEELLSETAERIHDGEPLDLFEGYLTGKLYTETGTGYMQLELRAGTPVVTSVSDPGEELSPLLSIEPAEDEVVTGSIDTMTFTGGD